MLNYELFICPFKEANCQYLYEEYYNNFNDFQIKQDVIKDINGMSDLAKHTSIYCTGYRIKR